MSGRIISEISTIGLAVAMALLVWVAAVREENPVTTNIYPQSIPLRVIDPAEELVVANQSEVPGNIQLQVQAPQSSWERLTPGKFEAWIDLSDRHIGLQDVPIRVNVSDPKVTVIDSFPPEVSVLLEPLVKREQPALVRISGEPPLGFTYRLPGEPFTVTVSGPVSLVQEVDRVEGNIVLNGVRETVQREVRLVPRNMANETVREVTIEPARMPITVTVEQRFGYNNVGVNVRLSGEPAAGYFISHISTEPAEIILRGPGDAPSSVDTAVIDVSGVTEDVIKRAPLSLPPGFSVEAVSEEDPQTNRSVLVEISVSAFTDGISVDRQVVVQGAAPAQQWTIDPEVVEVFLTGPWPELQDLTEEDLVVLVDLFDLSPGTHRLTPTVIKPETLTVASIIPDSIQVTLEPNRPTLPAPDLPLEPGLPVRPTTTVTGSTTLTATATPGPSPTSVNQATDTIAPTATLTATEAISSELSGN